MAAGQGFKTFTTGEVLTAGDVNGYLMQGVLVFASAAARNAAITSPQEGQFAYTKDTNGLWYYDGAAWVASGATGDIEGVTATSPLTGGGTSGTVTVGIQDASTSQRGSVQLSDSTSTTSSVLAATPTAVKSAYDLAAAAIPKSTVTTNGDIIYGTGSATVTRRGIGTTGQVLTVSGGVPTWATPSSGSMTLIASGTLSSATTTISSISNAYNNLVLIVDAYWESGQTATPSPGLRFNNDNNTAYYNFTGTTNGANWDRQSSQFLLAGPGTTSTGYSQIEIFDYASTTHWKVGRMIGAGNSHVSASLINAFVNNVVWNSTAAIDTLTFGAPVSGWSAGNYRLYGVK